MTLHRTEKRSASRPIRLRRSPTPCSACRRDFASPDSFVAHRLDRRCLTEADMVEGGWSLTARGWRRPT